MKNKKRIFILLFALCFIALVLICLFSRSELEKRVESYKEYYAQCWKLRYVKEDAEKKHIDIGFEWHSNYIEKKESALITQKVLTEAIIFNADSKWKEYTMDICFEYVGEQFRIENISMILEYISVTDSGMRISLELLSQYIPNARKLCLAPASYSSIQEIKGFERLDEVYFTQGTTQEEKEYIGLLFPTCTIVK